MEPHELVSHQVIILHSRDSWIVQAVAEAGLLLHSPIPDYLYTDNYAGWLRNGRQDILSSRLGRIDNMRPNFPCVHEQSCNNTKLLSRTAASDHLQALIVQQSDQRQGSSVIVSSSSWRQSTSSIPPRVYCICSDLSVKVSLNFFRQCLAFSSGLPEETLPKVLFVDNFTTTFPFGQ
jgi:hypothetical protein